MKKFLVKTGGLWKTLAVVFALVFALAFVVGNLLEDNSAQVNRVLGTTTTTVVSGGDDVETYSIYTPAYENSAQLRARHVELGTRVGAEGSVLLKNDGALPFDKGAKVTLFGVASTAAGGYFGMTLGGTVAASQNVSLYDALTDRGVSVNPDMSSYYESAASSMANSDNTISTSFGTVDSASRYTPYEAAVDTSRIGSYTDVGIVVVGRPSTESGDYHPGSIGVNAFNTGARNVLALTYDELDMIEAAKKACDKVVVLVNASNAMELGPIAEGGDYEVDSILWVGFPGNYGYLGVADVLLGDANPSGRLTDTYAYDSTSAPAMQNFGIYAFTNGEAVDSEDYGKYYLVEAEGIYTGYKYYETRYEDSVLGQGNATSTAGAFDSADGWNYSEEVAYSFGEGLSYTTFSQKITGVTFSSDYRTATVTVLVENTGSVPGRSVVQIYGQSPYTDYDRANGVEKASVQLLDYYKTDEIPAGGSEYVSVDIDMELLASYDTDGKGTYIMEAGDYYFALGCNDACEGAHAAVNNILAAKGKGVSDGMDAEGDASAVYAFRWNAADEDIFSVSKAGVSVTNQLDVADLNYWKSGTSVTYLSRSDWEWKDSAGTTLWNTKDWSSSNMKGYTGVTATASMLSQLGNDTYQVHTDDDVSGILFDQDNGLTFADMIDSEGNVLDYDDEKWDLLMDELNLEEAVTFISQGNRVYSSLSGINFVGGTYTENGPTGLQVTIPSAYDAPWFDANDPNSSYQWADMGSAPLQAATFDRELMESIGEMWGNDSLFVNLPVLWAPSLNLHRTQYNGRAAEYYSEDSVLSGYSALEVSLGAEKYGLIVSIKHFAFNDQESNRLGIAPFMTEQQARENELRGFQIAFEGGVKATMTAFNRIGCTYVGANEGLMQGILRGEWDYNGYAVSDNAGNPGYMTFTEAVLCGTTNFDTTSMAWGSADELARLYARDADMLQAIKNSVHSTLWTFAHTNMANYMTAGATQKWVANWWRVTYITLEVVGGVVAVAGLVLLVISAVVGGRKEDSGAEGAEGEQEARS